MKPKVFLVLIVISAISISMNAQLEVLSSGKVGVGYPSPNYDFEVRNVETSTSNYAYSAFYMDNVNNYLRLNKKDSQYGNEIQFKTNNSHDWSFGMTDKDVAGDGDELFIGEYAKGSNALIWMEPDGSGYVGIGTTSPDDNYKLTVYGDAKATGTFYSASDIRVKKNIESVAGAIDKVLQLRGITYDFIDNYFQSYEPINDSSVNFPADSANSDQHEFKPYTPITGKRYGVIAQEVQEIIPELVHEADSGVSWNVLKSGYPENIPAHCIEYDENTGLLYVGTDVGIYYWDTDNPSSWTKIDDELNTIISEIVINKTFGKLRVATYGSGIWETDLPLCQEIYSDANIITDWTISDTHTACSNIIIVDGATLTVTGTLYMERSRTITVKNNSTLKISGGIGYYTDIVVESGGELIIENNGKLVLDEDDDVSVESGGTFDYSYGSIETR